MYQRILIATALVAMLFVGSVSACPEDKGMKQHQQGTEEAMNSHEPIQKHFARKVIAAVSKSGIDSAQAKKVTEAINTFKTIKMQFKKKPPLPLGAFKEAQFDKHRFTEALLSKPTAMASAKGDLLESIFRYRQFRRRSVV